MYCLLKCFKPRHTSCFHWARSMNPSPFTSLLCAKLKQPADIAKIYYTMACICRKNGRFDESLGYFKSELKVTKSALGKHHVETCRIYHDMARIYDESLGDYELSLKYYAKALKVEQRALKKCTNVSRKEGTCRVKYSRRNSAWDEFTTSVGNSVKPYMCRFKKMLHV